MKKQRKLYRLYHGEIPMNETAYEFHPQTAIKELKEIASQYDYENRHFLILNEESGKIVFRGRIERR